MSAQLTSQAIERAILEIVKQMGEDAFSEFIALIRAGAPRSALQAFLNSSVKGADTLIHDKLFEVVGDFKAQAAEPVPEQGNRV